MYLESVSVVITQPAATACIKPPRLDSSVANQSERKIGWLKGANAPDALGDVELVGEESALSDMHLSMQVFLFNRMHPH